jgi:hypothetical protein
VHLLLAPACRSAVQGTSSYEKVTTIFSRLYMDFGETMLPGCPESDGGRPGTVRSRATSFKACVCFPLPRQSHMSWT